MDALVTWSSALLLALWVVRSLEVAVALRRTCRLRDVAPEVPGPWPKVSIVIPARDEAEHVEAAMRSVLASDYADFEVVAVDDRSSDGTGAALDALATADKRLRVLHVTALPEGWLGKPHAIWRGAAETRGALLLLADADVELAPDTLRRAVARLEGERLDFLTASPDVTMRTLPGNVFFTFLGLMFFQLWKPWKVRDPRSRRGLAIGAFMLMRRATYDAVGTYRRVRLCAIDDLRFGQAVKAAGLRAEVVSGADQIHVEWYPSLAATVRGLTKNSFAANGYSIPGTCLVALVILGFYTWPWIGWALVEGPGRALLLACVAVALCGFVDYARIVRTGAWQGLAMPLAALVLVYIGLRSMILTLVRGGVVWRGTHYDLALLKRGVRSTRHPTPEPAQPGEPAGGRRDGPQGGPA